LGEEYRSWSSSFSSFLQYPITSACHAQISPSAPHSLIPSAYVLPSTWETKFHTHTKQQAKL
jgi:hypothetical protein